jgi:hypothetical protein
MAAVLFVGVAGFHQLQRPLRQTTLVDVVASTLTALATLEWPVMELLSASSVAADGALQHVPCQSRCFLCCLFMVRPTMRGRTAVTRLRNVISRRRAALTSVVDAPSASLQGLLVNDTCSANEGKSCATARAQLLQLSGGAGSIPAPPS